MTELTNPMPETPESVLIVDRERLGNLISRMLGEKYSTDVVSHGMWAINKLQKVLPDVIVVDVDVPGNGIRMTELVGISPAFNTVPIILMGANATRNMVVRARNAGASSFLAKPFGPGELQKRLDTALASASCAAASAGSEAQSDPEDNTDQANGLMNRVKAIEGLPSFPATHAEILKLAKSEEATSDDLAEKIQLDPGLLATVFKLVNSSYYGFSRKIDSLNLAVTLLGFEEIANLVMTAQVFEKLGNYEDGGGLDLQAFWQHSIGTAFIARAIAKKIQTETESAFLAGMLHDLGKIVLDRYFADYYGSVVERVKQEEMPIVRAEQEMLGMTHADIGGQLAMEWQFADTFLQTILYHHHPARVHKHNRLVCLVHLADVVCRQLGYGSGGDGVVPEADERALECFSLNEERMQELTEAAEAQLQGADSFLAALGS